VRFHAHAGIDREAPIVFPVAHRLGVLALEHSAVGANAQKAVTHLGLDLRDSCRTDAAGFVSVRTACAIGLENTVDHDTVEVDVGIEQGAKAVDEDHRANAGSQTRRLASPAHTLLHRREQEVQDQGLHGRVTFSGHSVAASVPTAPIGAPVAAA
jgi:hypothetical protein